MRHCKKKVSDSPSPAGMSLTKLSMSGNNLIIPGQGNCQARLRHVLNTVGFIAGKTRKATPKELKRKQNQFLRRLPGKDY
jgi:hypothetical protein